MIVGIDASNIRAGGGITHLVGLLSAADPSRDGFDRVLVWSGSHTLAQLPERDWLIKQPTPMLDRRLPWRLWWQQRHLPAAAAAHGCHVLFVPGGGHRRVACPVVTMSQNLLPFDWREMVRYGPFPFALRLLLLRWSLLRAFRRAQGLIFLTRYAQDRVRHATGPLAARTVIIPHGVSERFHSELVEHAVRRDPDTLRVVYVSQIDIYKHQWHVVEAVAAMRAKGVAISLNLVGAATRRGEARLRRTLRRCDPRGEFVRYAGALPYAEIHRVYSSADAVVFASSCENLPQALLEGMASGLPVACSSRGPMPEILGDAGVYFDPEDPAQIEAALERLLRSPALCDRLGELAQRRAATFGWARCARLTFALLRDVSRGATPSSA